MKQFKLHIGSISKITKDELEQKIRKVGLDSNILIDMVLNPLTQDFVLSNYLIVKKVLCTSFKCKSEAIKVLTEKYNVKDAEKEINSLLQKLKIFVFLKTDKDKGLAKKYVKEYANIGAHFQDTLILANFENNNVTHIASIEPTILAIARRIGFWTIKIPSRDKINEIMFKRIMRH